MTFFQDEPYGFAGQYLSDRFIQDPDRPPDQLLRWHFRQAVLANLRGEGEPVFEQDFPPGSDMIGEILEGPRAADWMEFELFSRLSGLPEVSLKSTWIAARHQDLPVLHWSCFLTKVGFPHPSRFVRSCWFVPPVLFCQAMIMLFCTWWKLTAYDMIAFEVLLRMGWGIGWVVFDGFLYQACRGLAASAEYDQQQMVRLDVVTSTLFEW